MGLLTFILTWVATFPVSGRVLCAYRTPSSGGMFPELSRGCPPSPFRHRTGEIKGVEDGMGVSGELMENEPRHQLHPGHHGTYSDRCLGAYGELPPDVRLDKRVSRSAPLLTATFASFVPLVLPCIATRPSVTSAPTRTRSSSTQPSSTSGPTQVQRPPARAPVDAL